MVTEKPTKMSFKQELAIKQALVITNLINKYSGTELNMESVLQTVQ